MRDNQPHRVIFIALGREDSLGCLKLHGNLRIFPVIRPLTKIILPTKNTNHTSSSRVAPRRSGAMGMKILVNNPIRGVEVTSDSP